MGLKIKGFAAPFDVANSYGEILDAATFKAWFAAVDHTHEIKMRYDHTADAGCWHRVWADDAGIWCEGEITHSQAIAWAQRAPARKRQLSINYGEWSGEYSKPGHKTEMTPMRFGEALNASGVSNGLASLAAYEATRHIGECIPKYGVCIVKGPRAIKHIDHFVEISLTDSGAYAGTHFEIVA